MLKARATHAEKDVVNNFVKIIVGRIKKSCNFAAQKINGVLAQLVERLNGIQKVRSSILLCSTKPSDYQAVFLLQCLDKIVIQNPEISSGDDFSVFKKNIKREFSEGD